MTFRMTLKPAITAMLIGVAASGGANAATLTEDFEAPFPAWESGWFGVNSDASNWYCSGRGCTDRGNNPDGLWLGDINPAINTIGNIVVSFQPGFGASLSALQIDVAAYSPVQLTALDSYGNTIFDESVALTFGATSDPGVYSTYTITSTTGIASFSFSGEVAGGFTSIDNLVATVVPEPASVALLLAGLAVVGAATRRKA